MTDQQRERTWPFTDPGNPFTGLRGLRLLLSVSVVFAMFLLLEFVDRIETAWQEVTQ